MNRHAKTSAAPPLAFEQVLDALGDPVLACDERGTLLYLNEAAERLLGWQEPELKGKPLATLIPAALRPSYDDAIVRFIATGRSALLGRPLRVAVLDREGEQIDVELTLSELRPEFGRLLVVAVLRDLRERVKLELKVAGQRRYTSDDLSFAGELAWRAAAAVDNARLYDEAKRAIGVRDQFLSIASHELRTPLTSLTLHLSSLSRAALAGAFAGLPTADKLNSRIARMQQQAVRLTSLIDELLNVSRISAGRLALDLKPMDLVEVTREVIDRLTEDAQRAGSSLELHATESVAGTWDRNRLDQVITNLVGNAIKYAAGKPIEVRIDTAGTLVRLVVRDHGPGIGEEDQNRIFAQFERAAPAALAGLGLGLWISKSIVEAHGGRIELASTPGRGATFTVELPGARRA